MEIREFRAKTVEEAITEATITLGTTSDNIGYEVVTEGSTGLLGMFAKEAVIRVWKKADEEAEARAKEAEEKAAAKKAAKAAKAAEEAERKEAAKAKKAEKAACSKGNSVDVVAFLTEVLEKMEMPSEVKMTEDDAEKTINIEIESADSGDIIGKKGQTLDALQYLASIVANRDRADYYRVKLDTKNYRERRQKTLENLAKNVASKVKKTRHKVVLEPMNPYERRIIHAYLQADENITTKSEGEEPNRRIVVYYKK